MHLSVFKKNKTTLLRQAWTGGSPVSSPCTDRTDFKLLKIKQMSYKHGKEVLKICTKTRICIDLKLNCSYPF